MKFKTLPLIALLTVFTGGLVFGQSTSGEWKTYSDENFTIQYPPDWSLDKSGTMNTVFVLMSKSTSGKDAFRENVNLLMQDMTGQGIDLEQYVAISTAQIENVVPDGKLLSSNTMKGNGTKFHHMVYTGTQGDLNLQFEQYYWVIDEIAYVLTLSIELDQVDKYRPIGTKILESFQFNQ